MSKCCYIHFQPAYVDVSIDGQFVLGVTECFL